MSDIQKLMIYVMDCLSPFILGVASDRSAIFVSWNQYWQSSNIYQDLILNFMNTEIPCFYIQLHQKITNLQTINWDQRIICSSSLIINSNKSENEQNFAFIKNNSDTSLDIQSASLASQITFMTLPSFNGMPLSSNLITNSPISNKSPLSSLLMYQTIQNILHYGITNYLTSLIASQDQKANDQWSNDQSGKEIKSIQTSNDKEALNSALKKLADVELALTHLQSDIKIPEAQFHPTPVIAQCILNSENQKKDPNVDDLPPLTSDLIQQLQNSIKFFSRDISLVTRSLKTDSISSTSREINDWISMEKELDKISKRLKDKDVILTLEALRKAKAFQTILAFENDPGLKSFIEKVKRYNILMRDFPMDDLLSANDLKSATSAIETIFQHINKKLRLSEYPISRVLNLMEAISSDADSVLMKLLSARRLMFLNYNEFDHLIQSVNQFFDCWDDQSKEFILLVREVTRKRNEKFLPIRFNMTHTKLKERVGYLASFRKQHHQLRNTIAKVMGSNNRTEITGTNGQMTQDQASNEKTATTISQDTLALEEIDLAYQEMKSVDVLDVSEGSITIHF